MHYLILAQMHTRWHQKQKTTNTHITSQKTDATFFQRFFHSSESFEDLSTVQHFCLPIRHVCIETMHYFGRAFSLEIKLCDCRKVNLKFSFDQNLNYYSVEISCKTENVLQTILSIEYLSMNKRSLWIKMRHATW